MHIQSIVILVISVVGVLFFSLRDSRQRFQQEVQQVRNSTHRHTYQLHHMLNHKIKEAQFELNFLFKNRQAQLKGTPSFFYLAEIAPLTDNQLQIQWERAFDPSFERWSDQEVLDSIAGYNPSYAIYFRRVSSKKSESYITAIMQKEDKIYLGFLPIYFFSDIDKHYKGSREKAIVVDNKGYAFVYPERRHLFQQVGQHAIIKEILSKKKNKGSGKYLDFKGQEMIGSYQRAANSNLYGAIMQYPPSLADLNKKLLNQLIIALIIVLITGGLLYSLGSSFTRKYRYLSQGIGALIKGNPIAPPLRIGAFWSKTYKALVSIQNRMDAKTGSQKNKEPQRAQEELDKIKDLGPKWLQSCQSILSVILGHAQMACEQAKGQLVEHLETIQKEARQLQETNDKLLKLMGYEERALVKVDLRQVILDELGALNERFKAQKVRLSKKMSQPVFLHAVEDHVRRLVKKLLTHSLESVKKYVQKDILIDLSYKENQAHLVIKDTGHGIPEPILKQVLNPEAFPKRDESVLAVNLSIIVKLVQSLGGTVHINSKSEKGSTFLLAFPAVPGETKVTKEASKTSPFKQEAHLETEKTLEDQEDVAHLPNKPQQDGLLDVDVSKELEPSSVAPKEDVNESWEEKTYIIGSASVEQLIDSSNKEAVLDKTNASSPDLIAEDPAKSHKKEEVSLDKKTHLTGKMDPNQLMNQLNDKLESAKEPTIKEKEDVSWDEKTYFTGSMDPNQLMSQLNDKLESAKEPTKKEKEEVSLDKKTHLTGKMDPNQLMNQLNDKLESAKEPTKKEKEDVSWDEKTYFTGSMDPNQLMSQLNDKLESAKEPTKKEKEDVSWDKKTHLTGKMDPNQLMNQLNDKLESAKEPTKKEPTKKEKEDVSWDEKTHFTGSMDPKLMAQLNDKLESAHVKKTISKKESVSMTDKNVNEMTGENTSIGSEAVIMGQNSFDKLVEENPMDSDKEELVEETVSQSQKSFDELMVEAAKKELVEETVSQNQKSFDELMEKDPIDSDEISVTAGDVFESLLNSPESENSKVLSYTTPEHTPIQEKPKSKAPTLLNTPADLQEAIFKEEQRETKKNDSIQEEKPHSMEQLTPDTDSDSLLEEAASSISMSVLDEADIKAPELLSMDVEELNSDEDITEKDSENKKDEEDNSLSEKLISRHGIIWG